MRAVTVEAQAAPAHPTEQLADGSFDRGSVIAVSAQHATHDTYAAFIGTLLPVLIERLGIPIGAAGLLASAYRLPSILQPFLGYWADKYDARLLVVWMPVTTAIAISCLGLVPSYTATLVALLLAGLSSAAFHPAAGAMVTRVGGDRWGRATAYFQTGGEIGRMIGPVLIASVLTFIVLERIWILALPAVGISLYAFRVIAGKNARVPRPPPPAALGAALKARRGPISLIAIIVLLRSLSIASFQTYFPTFMTQLGYPLQIAGFGLTLYEIGAVGGQFLGGGLSDRLGRRRLMLASQISAGPMLFGALSFAGQPIGYAFLVVGGFLALLAGSAQQALMQELLPGNRSVATGISYVLGYESSVVATLVIGLVADWVGLASALSVSVWLSIASLPFTLLLPETRGRVSAH
jgi:FSR family fosmidomycin resistance protein-like MFS transporter